VSSSEKKIVQFRLDEPLEGVPPPPFPLWDAHLHVWDAGAFSGFERWANRFGVKRFTAIASPDVKASLEQRGGKNRFSFALYLPIHAFADHDTDTLLSSLEIARSQSYDMVKLWFGPRFLDFTDAVKPFAISHEAFEPVFARIEEYGMPVDIHVADPDIWYRRKYVDAERYRTKLQAVDEFTVVLDRHPGLRAISVHFGSLPEPRHRALLSSLLDRYPNLHIDTASTKWVVRELGRDPLRAREFIVRYQRRILFASDLSIGRFDEEEGYYAKRYWSQRLFWETGVREVPLPFSDKDNDEGPTIINGLELSRDVLENLYWKNAGDFFES
jgi:predicted TIM-barrel fold metal-dependent hydrolase